MRLFMGLVLWYGEGRICALQREKQAIILLESLLHRAAGRMPLRCANHRILGRACRNTSLEKKNQKLLFKEFRFSIGLMRSRRK